MAAITQTLRRAAVFAATVFATAVFATAVFAAAVFAAAVLAATILAACVGVVAAIAGAAEAANKTPSAERSVAGKTVRFPSGSWSGLPKIGPDKSNNHLPSGEPIDASLAIDKKPFDGVSAQVLGSDEIGIFPEHGATLAQALGEGAIVVFKAPKVADDMTFPVQSGVVPWLRACARRNGIGIEPEDAKRKLGGGKLAPARLKAAVHAGPAQRRARA